nr:MAG TPA: hypothetical protein [Caudoviricetes sp.]
MGSLSDISREWRLSYTCNYWYLLISLGFCNQ